MIRQGAKLVESVQDILEELPDFAAASTAASTATAAAPVPRRLYRKPSQQLPLADASHDAGKDAPPTDPVLQAMGFDPVLQDVLAARCGLGSAELAAHLLGLELDGLVARLPDGAYQRSGSTS